MLCKQLFVLVSLTTFGNSLAYTCFYQELHDPKTKKSIGWPGAWEQCVDDAKKKGPQTNLVVWLEDDNGKFVRGEFATGDIKTAEWHEIEVGQEQQFLSQGAAKSTGRAKSEQAEQPQPKATKPSKPAKKEQAAAESQPKEKKKPSKEQKRQQPKPQEKPEEKAQEHKEKKEKEQASKASGPSAPSEDHKKRGGHRKKKKGAEAAAETDNAT